MNIPTTAVINISTPEMLTAFAAFLKEHQMQVQITSLPPVPMPRTSTAKQIDEPYKAIYRRRDGTLAMLNRWLKEQNMEPVNSWNDTKALVCLAEYNKQFGVVLNIHDDEYAANQLSASGLVEAANEAKALGADIPEGADPLDHV